MISHQLTSHGPQRLVHRRNLRHDVRAVAIILHHLLESAHLAFDSPEALHVAGLDVRIDGDGVAMLAAVVRTTATADDLEIAVERTLVDGEWCTAYCRVKGRHVGHMLGGPPTDRPVEFTGVTIARVRDGKLIEGWNVFDFLTMYQQIGWVGTPPVP